MPPAAGEAAQAQTVAAAGSTRELTEKVIWRCRAEWDAFLDRASGRGAIKLVLIVDPQLTTRVDQAR